MALLNKNHLKSLVAVGFMKDGKFVCDSTSFLVGFLVENSDDPAKRLYRTFLVTNRHVFDKREKVCLRFNTDDEKIKTFEQNLYFANGDTQWLAHSDPEIDLALLNVSPTVLKKNNIQPIFLSEEMFGYFEKFEETGIAVGDDAYVIGFPMGIAGEEQNYPCVKAALISRIDNEIIKAKKAFIVDSSIFPGNSGGPVILKPTMASLSDTKAVEQPYLLGVISAYLPYTDTLYTHQTNPPTAVSITRENSGLSFCVPIDFVKEIYNAWLNQQKPVEEPQKNTNLKDLKEKVKTSMTKTY